jgi:Domain of unknown function (DUF4142)
MAQLRNRAHAARCDDDRVGASDTAPFVVAQRGLEVATGCERLIEHDRVFNRLTRTLPKIRRHRMRRIAEYHHTSLVPVNQRATALVKKLKVTPEDNPTSQSLKAGGEKNVTNLKTLKGAAFDKAYLDNEVTYHQAVLDALDKTLVPNASNAELKALLVKVRPAFVAHLEHAKQLQSTLK